MLSATPECETRLHVLTARSILGMVDGAVLLVDAVEGPLAQTKFVLAKALSRGLAPIVVLNKVDRPAATQARCDAVASQLFDLFASLGADDRQLDFPILYASSKQVRLHVAGSIIQFSAVEWSVRVAVLQHVDEHCTLPTVHPHSFIADLGMPAAHLPYSTLARVAVPQAAALFSS
jgi:predicted membrane GTPase involved in stress response